MIRTAGIEFARLDSGPCSSATTFVAEDPSGGGHRPILDPVADRKVSEFGMPGPKVALLARFPISASGRPPLRARLRKAIKTSRTNARTWKWKAKCSPPSHSSFEVAAPPHFPTRN